MKTFAVVMLFTLSTLLQASKMGNYDDSSYKSLMKQACFELGNSCEKYKQECGPHNTNMPNACLSEKYFDLEVAKEKCGENFLECYERNNSYAAKWMHELNLPNANHPDRKAVFDVCWKEAAYNVKSAKLKKFESSLIEANGGEVSSAHTDFEVLYSCFSRYFDAKTKN